MGMFDNYENIPSDYTPNNMFPVGHTIYREIDTNNLKIETSLIGNKNYKWNYGETFNIDYTVNTDITIMNDDIIFRNKGEEPTQSLIGELNQRIYNVVDIKEWICKEIIDDNIYNWELQKTFIVPANGDKSETLTPDYSDKIITINFYDYRRELFYTEELVNNDNIFTFEMTSEKSKDFIKGVYYLEIKADDTILYKIVCRVN